MNTEHKKTEPAPANAAAAHAPGTAPAEAPPSAPTLEELLQATQAERDENLNRFLRSQAELENFRKRVQRERDEERRYAALSIVRDLLAPLDNLQRAIESARKSGESGNLLQGIELVVQQMERVLSSHGAKVIPAVGQPFDPHLHEAVQQVPSDEQPPMTVLQELERGYTLHERVVRPSKVIVSAANAENQE